MCWICLFFVSLSFFLNHRFCENAELRASFHHVKTLFSSPCPCLSALPSWHVHTCALCSRALSHQLFCWLCVWSNTHRPCSLLHLCRPTQGLFLSQVKWQVHYYSVVDSDLRQGLAVIYWAAMGCRSWIFCLSHSKHRNNNSACSPHKWYFCRQCLMHVTPVCAGAGYPKQGKPMHSSSSGSTMKFFPAF